jgi:hypothetical protein
MRPWPVAVALALAAPLAAQNPPPARPDTLVTPSDTVAVPDTGQVQRTRGDSIRPVPPISATGAFLRSLVLPGWGQARLGRNVTGGLFLLWEGVCAAMVWKAQWQLDYARARGKWVKSHTQEREDWIVLLVFNHLLAGAEAYVSANLFDFPKALKIQRLPDGRTAIGVSAPLP